MTNPQPPHVQLRVRDTWNGKPQILVVDFDGNVLGDLAMSTAGVRWQLGNSEGPSIVSVDIACERASIDGLGSNPNAVASTQCQSIHPTRNGEARCELSAGHEGPHGGPDEQGKRTVWRQATV